MKKSLIQLHGAVFLWGFTGVLGRAISLDAVSLVWYRLLITVISLWALFYFQKKITRISIATALKISLPGFILALHWVCFYGSIKLANVTIALTCLSTSALMASLMEPVVLRKRFDPFELFLGMIALAGIFIIYNTHIGFSIGIFIGLLAALLNVLVSVLNKKMIDHHPPQEITLYQLTGGFAGLTLLLPLGSFFSSSAGGYPAAFDWVWLLVLSWVCTIFTFFLYIRSLKKVSAFTMNLTLTLEPVYGIILAFLIYHENQLLSNWFYLGFGLIALTVVFHTLRLIRSSKKGNPHPVY